MSEIDQQFVEYVVKSLVGNPDAVVVDRRVDEKGVLLELTVDPEDLGRVIGKRGATAQSLRTLLRALGTKNEARYNLKIIDNGVGEHRRNDDAAQAAPAVVASDVADDSATLAASAPVDDALAEETETTPAEKVADVEVETPAEDTAASDRLAATRRELADLDDLDV
jgi:predicted RNA-binding protein YlqC (UPF0109 family)